MLRGLGGIAVLLAIAWLLSEDRRRIPFRVVYSSLALQIALALLLVLAGSDPGLFPGFERVLAWALGAQAGGLWLAIGAALMLGLLGTLLYWLVARPALRRAGASTPAQA